MAADPPFEMAGAGTRRLLGALTVLTAISLTVVLTLLASRAPMAAPGPEIRQRVFLADVNVPEIFPSPPRSRTAQDARRAPAVQPPGSTPMGAELEIIVQRPQEEGRYSEDTIRERGVASSWDNFKLRYHVGQRAWVTLWHVESQGRVQRIYPADPHTTASQVHQVGWSELPGNDRWFYLDDKRGQELFVLTVSAQRPQTDPTFAEGLERAERLLIRARRPAPDRLVLRGIGGTRDRVEPSGGDSAAVVGRLLDRFRARFDHVQVVELEHR